MGMDQWGSENDSGGPFGADSECQASLYTPAQASRYRQDWLAETRCFGDRGDKCLQLREVDLLFVVENLKMPPV